MATFLVTYHGGPGMPASAEAREQMMAAFQAWAAGVASRFGYDVRFLPIGDEDSAVGPPTQMAVFTRVSDAESTRQAAESDAPAKQGDADATETS